MAKLVVGVNDLGTVNPELAAQWHPTKNGAMTPQDVGIGSNKKIWWMGDCEHEWESRIDSRSNGAGCPKCAGQIVQIGFNDLATVDPELAAQWHPILNGVVTSQDTTLSSGRSAWWICPLLHEWRAIVASRSSGTGCPTCAGKIVQIGFNDLATVNPELAAQWHPTKNGVRTPQGATKGFRQKAWWVCDSGHEWEAVINSRSRGNGCPKCSAGTTEAYFQKTFEKLSGCDFDSHRISLVRLSRSRQVAQIDMLNDDLKLVIEYDGEWTHGARNPEGKTLEEKFADDKETTQALADIGYKVIRIREHSYQEMLPFVPLDTGYESNVFQIIYKSFGKDKDDIETLTQRIIEEKADWFKASSELMNAA